MGGHDTTVASFDVFETVMARRVGDPHAVFLLLGRRANARGLLDCSAHAFARARADAEVRSFRNAGGLDSTVTLATIYAELANALHMPIDQRDTLYEAELELEDELLVTIDAGAELVSSARERGDQVVYVSDMYVPDDIIRRWLTTRGLFRPGDALFVSNSYGKSKATGSLWPVVLDSLPVPASQVHHVGNDARSDGFRARRAGLQADVLESFNLNRYEQALENHRDETDGLSSALAGASRLARIALADEGDITITDVAAGVVAPFVIGNLLWTLAVARKEGLAELFFVARDGQVLSDVAEVLAKKVGYEGRLTYIYGSRQAWSLGALTDHQDGLLDALIPDEGDVDASVCDALHRLDIEPDEIAESLTAAGFERSDWDLPMPAGAALQLRSVLRNDPIASQLLRDRSKRSRELVLQYLEQVGVVTNEQIGFVDLGTGATLFNALSSILSTVGQAPPMGFYFGLRSHLADLGFGKPLTYFRNEEANVGFLRTPGLLTFVELACTADHGSVLGYEDVVGEIRPILEASGNVPVVEWGLPLIHRTVCRVAKELLVDPELVGVDTIDLRPAILDVFSLFWTSPTKAEAATWGAYPFEDGWGSRSFRHPIAQSQGLMSVLRPEPYRHFWRDGANRLSGPVTRSAMEVRASIVDVRNKVRSGGARSAARSLAASRIPRR